LRKATNKGCCFWSFTSMALKLIVIDSMIMFTAEYGHGAQFPKNMIPSSLISLIIDAPHRSDFSGVWVQNQWYLPPTNHLLRKHDKPDHFYVEKSVQKSIAIGFRLTRAEFKQSHELLVSWSRLCLCAPRQHVSLM